MRSVTTITTTMSSSTQLKHGHHQPHQTRGSSAKRIISPSPPSSSLLQSTATSPKQPLSKPNFKPKSPPIKQLNHIDHQSVPYDSVDSPRSDKSRSSHGRLSSPVHENHTSKFHQKSTTSKPKPLASAVPLSKKSQNSSWSWTWKYT